METMLSTYIDNKQSFFLYAGAGSGKTYALVELLNYIKSTRKTELEQARQKVAVITYTNAATDEIKRRIGFDPLFDISTIHSFVWEMIHPYQEDIRNLLIAHIQKKMEEYETMQNKMRDTQCKTYLDRQARIDKYKERLDTINRVSVFKYNPNGDNSDSDSLNHSDVIEIGAKLFAKPLLQRIMVQRYPYIMIDESQDTKKEVMLAMLEMAKSHQGRLTLGLFGDVKQRIYMDGVPDIEVRIPEEWGLPVLRNNYRSASKIVHLANLIAKEMQAEDKSGQNTQADARIGCKRLYIIKNDDRLDKDKIEHDILEDMAAKTGDDKWRDAVNVKTLILEHRMAAVRLGFENFYDKLYNVGRYSEDFLKGEAADMRVFMEVVFPILEAKACEDNERVFEIVQDNCVWMSKKVFLNVSQMKEVSLKLKKVTDACLLPTCTIGDALKSVVESELFKVSPMLTALVKEGVDSDFSESQMEALEAWKQVTGVPLAEFYHYFEYVTERSRFATHQGVKGLEYDRVMVIYDDADSRGRSFSYEKLFGAKALSEADLKNIREGKETSVQRTMRLLYVTCTRAKESLALVTYTNSPDTVYEYCLSKSWFEDDEIKMVEYDS